ncbi:hypothetical protein MDAP_000322 [Mitosporidium daphniae]
MILISEFCDKTFFLAAVLSMRSRRHDKVKVFLGSILALALMSLLSVLLGGFIFTWIPMLYTKIASTLLFFMFSVLMVREAILSQPSTASSLAVSSSTLSPARIEREQEGSHSFTSVLSFRDNDKHEDSDNDKNKEQSKKPGEFLFSKSFILTLIAEWGDRSQLATIALATSKNLPGVLLGSILGHIICTGTAVIGGSFIATRLSIRKVTLAGALLFFLFFVTSIWEIAFDSAPPIDFIK